MTTFEPMDTAEEPGAVTMLLSKMFEFDPTLTLPENAMKTRKIIVSHFTSKRVAAPETTALYQTELFSPMETSPITDALRAV